MGTAAKRALTIAMCSLAAVSLGGAPAPADARTVLSGVRELHDPAMDAGALYYRAFTRRHEVVRRLDLRSARSRVIYRKRKEPYSIDALQAGGGRVVIAIGAPLERDYRTAVLELDPGGGRPNALERGRYSLGRSGDCGSFVRLLDVSPEGDVVAERAVTPCAGEDGPGSRALRVHDAAGHVSELGQPPLEDAFELFDGDDGTRVVNQRLLRWNNFAATVTSLADGAVRTLPHSRGWIVGDADLDSSGSVLVNEFRFRDDRLTGARTRMFEAPEQGGATTVLTSRRAAYAGFRFCGSRLLQQRFSRGGLETVLIGTQEDGYRVVDRKRLEEDDYPVLLCDAATVVRVTHNERRRRFSVEALALP